jgi:tetratricopeptide (TPR) repeat protein
MEEMARETIRVSEAHFGAENLAVADALGQLGQALMYLRELDESETVTRESIAMQRKLRGADSLEEAFGLQNLGDILRYRGFRKDSIEDRLRIFEEAEAVDRACLRIRQRRLPGDSDELAVAYENLCQILDAQGRTGEAEEYIRASYEMARRLFGDEHPRTAKYCVGLGYLIGHSSDRLAEAESYIRRGLETQIRTQGREKFSLSYCHGQLGEILEKQGKLDDAELHYREAVAIGRRQLGANDPDLLNFLGSCAGLLKKRRKLDEARALAEEAVAFSRRLDRTHPLAQQGSFILLTEVLEAQGDGAALEALAAEALQDVRSRPVVDEPQLVVALTNLAKVMRQNGKPVEARPVAEEAVAICEHETSPVENWMRDDAFNELVEVLTAIGGDAALQALAVHRVQDLRSRPVVDQPRLAVALVDLAVVEHQAGELARARVLAEEAAAICEHNPGRIESWLQYRAFAELTDVLLDLGDKPALGDFADRLISRAESSGNTEQLAAGYAQAIPLLAGSDRSEQARDLVDRLVALDVPNGTADNRAAWFLATAEDPAWRDAALAVELSTRAVDSDPQVGSWWNTRGVAQYRAGDLQQAVSDLETSMQLGGGGNSFDFFFLAMIHEQLGDSVAALQWYEQGIAWMKRDSPTSHELQRFRAEAAELLGISELPSTARQTGGGARLEPVQE